ncbi:MAG: hypothetical protein WAX80_01530 [Minisyncoccia bacterium]
MTATYSQVLFEEYLQAKSLVLDRDYFYERDLGKPTKPDYFVKDIGGDLLFEVKEFSSRNKDEKKLRAAMMASPGQPAGFTRNPYSQIRETIHKAKRQLRHYKTEYPCMLILHKGDSMMASLDVNIVAAAAFGDLSMNDKLGWHFGRNGKLSPRHNRTFSAIGILEEFYPDREQAVKTFLAQHPPMQTDLMWEVEQRFDKWAVANKFDLEKRHVRLKVIINTFAYKQVPIEFFSNLNDEIYTTNESGMFGRSVPAA